MSDTGDSRLDALLRSRRSPVPGPDLAARIVREARRIPQRRSVSLAETLTRVFAELWLPRPAVALAATLIVGIVAGWAAPFGGADAQDDADAVYVGSFLYPDEDAS